MQSAGVKTGSEWWISMSIELKNVICDIKDIKHGRRLKMLALQWNQSEV